MTRRVRLNVGASLALSAVLLNLPSASSSAQGPSVAGEVLVRFSARAAKAADDRLMTALAPFAPVAVAPLLPRSRRARLAGAPAIERWVRVRYADAREPAAVAAACARLEGVEASQPNWLSPVASSPDDPLYPRQWGLGALAWPDVWPPGPGATVVVGVVDSGIDVDHPDLLGRIWRNGAEANGRAGVDDDGNGYVDDVVGWDFVDAPGLGGTGDCLDPDDDPDDESGHGTHVAGIIGAATGNGRGMAGVAARVQLMALRAGFNRAGGGFLADAAAAAAIAYAADNGARVVNLSWGDSRYAPVVADAVDYAAAAGCLLVAAAGNEGNDQVLSPARLRQVLAVAAVDASGGAAQYSNRGSAVDLAAPGTGVLSLIPGGGYGERTGTSMAAAFVSGVAALTLGRHPTWTAAQTSGALLASAADLGPDGWDAGTGAGLVQATAAAVADPPVLQLLAPEWDQNVADTNWVQLSLARLDEWRLEWREVADGAGWTLVAGGQDGGTVAAKWDTRTVPPGRCELRLRGRQGPCWLEDRVQVWVGPQAPAILAPAARSGLDRGHWSHWVQWQTSVPAAGSVMLTDSLGQSRRIDAPALQQDQWVRVPDDLPAGTWRVDVQAAAGRHAGAWTPAGTVTVAPLALPWEWSAAGHLPAGYAMPGPVDANRDGNPEVLVMPAADGRYAAIEVWGARPAGYGRLAALALEGIPWSMRDQDGNGWPELMAVSAGTTRLYEGDDGAPYPHRLVWEGDGFWGGEAADVDGDGWRETWLRRVQQAELVPLGGGPGAGFSLGPAQTNPTAGRNTLAVRQAVVPDSRAGGDELVAGDIDGDLFALGRDRAGRIVSTWSQASSADEGEVRLVGAVGDLDADGLTEFVVGRWAEDGDRPATRHWTICVFGRDGTGYRSEAVLPVLGGDGSGAVATADLDGDGELELVVASAPALYVLRCSPAGTWSPLTCLALGSTPSLSVGDLDGDGRAELVADIGDSLAVWRRPRTQDPRPAAVTGLVARAAGPGQVALTWHPTPGAAAYQVRRDGVAVASPTDTQWVDSAGVTGAAGRWTVAAVSAAGAIGPLQEAVWDRPGAAPRVVMAEQRGPRRVAVTFDVPVSVTSDEPFRFRLEPRPGPAASVWLDQGRTRVLLGFADDLPDTGQVTLWLDGVATLQGQTAAADLPAFTFALRPPDSLGEVTLRPHPYRIGGVPLRFAHLPQAAVVTIHGLAGDRVRSLPPAGDSGEVAWDGRNDAGQTVAAGLYLYRVEAQGQVRRGRLAVVGPSPGAW